VVGCELPLAHLAKAALHSCGLAGGEPVVVAASRFDLVRNLNQLALIFLRPAFNPAQDVFGGFGQDFLYNMPAPRTHVA